MFHARHSNRKKIAYLSHVDWDWIKQRPQFVAEGLARQLRVDYYFFVMRGGRQLKQKSARNKESLSFYRLIKLPFSGRFKPYKSLTQFNNLDPSGLWILKIYETAKENKVLTGVIKSWGITVTYQAGSIGIRQISTAVPDGFYLYQNYPNPFNPSTIIRFQIKDSRFVSLKVFDILGKEVATLVNEKLHSGIYEVPFSINQFSNNQIPSGVYFYRLSTDGFSETKKMLLIK